MTEIPNYREFYYRTPIQIGKNDRLSILKNELEGEKFTHWLIAMEGKEIDEKIIRWRIVVFPSQENGEINLKFPSYTSTLFNSIHDAISFTKEIESIVKEDQLFSFNTKEIV